MVIILEQNIVRIPLKQTKVQIPFDTVGIDIGQSLTKVAYWKDNAIELSMSHTGSNVSEVDEFLNLNKTRLNRVNFSGGKAFVLYKKYSHDFETRLINEFKANIKGLEFLYENYKKRSFPPSLVVTLGTGTSIVLNKEKIEHLGGSAMGGGFFMGLLDLIFNKTIADFSEVTNLASKGNRFQVDLKVGDIYDVEDDRVNKLFREFTAATLGKINKSFDLNSIKKEDIISSLIGVIGENLGTIATLMAENHEVKSIVFCGGFLIGNKPLKQILSLLCKFKRIKPIFIDNSVFAGAIGALLFNSA